MTNFNFAVPEISTVHEKWLKEQLSHTDLGLSVQIPGTRTVGVRKTRQDSDSPPLPAAIVVESLNETDYEILKLKYCQPEETPDDYKIKNLLIFCWTIKDHTVHCKLEYFAYESSIGSLALVQEALDILPTNGGDFVELPRKDFVHRADDTEVVRLDVSALRNEIRDLIQTYCGSQGLKAAGVEDDAPRHEPEVPTTREEFETALGNITQTLGLDVLYGEEQLTKFAEKAARNIEGALTNFGLPRSATMSLTKVNLFRTVIFCDDSGSMSGSLYREIQRDAVMRLAPLATRLNEDGVSLRFINFNGDGNWDNLKINQNVNELSTKYDSVTPQGTTFIGASLNRKVVEPLINSLDTTESIRPMLVSIITDGEAHDPDLFEATIQRCRQALVDKKMLNHPTLGHAAVIFQIHFIGGDAGASSFIDRLDKNIGAFIFCNKKRLDKHVVDPNLTPAQRYKLILDVSSSAIDRVLAFQRANATN